MLHFLHQFSVFLLVVSPPFHYYSSKTAKHDRYLIRNSKILDSIPTNVAFRRSPKPISILHQIPTQNPYVNLKKRKQIKKKYHYFCKNKNTKSWIKKKKTYWHLGCADDFTEMDVHPSITIDQMPIISLSIFQFHQLLQHTSTMNYKLHQKKWKGRKTKSTNLHKVLGSQGQITQQEKQRSLAYHRVALSSLK